MSINNSILRDASQTLKTNTENEHGKHDANLLRVSLRDSYKKHGYLIQIGEFKILHTINPIPKTTFNKLLKAFKIKNLFGVALKFALFLL